MTPRIEHVGRQVIERKLLTALEDESVAAVLVTEEDLTVIVECLRAHPFHTKAREMADDYDKLKRAAFPK